MNPDGNQGSPLNYLALELARVTELAAIEAAKWIGKGDKKAADKAAVDAMRAALNRIDFRGEIVIGEGAKDESFELFIGEIVGKGTAPELDIAVDPLECTSSVAYGRPNAITTIATGPKGSLYHAADSYMQKIAVPDAAKGAIDLDAPVADTIQKVAKALGKDVGEVTVAVLDRPRHEQLIKDIRAAGARIQLFTDGDIAMALAPCMPESPVDMLMGVGGSSEAVIASAGLKCLGGTLICRWQPKDETHIARLHAAGITDFSPIFTSNDLAKGDDVTFTATGVIAGPLAPGVSFTSSRIVTHSVVMSSRPKTVRMIQTHHQLGTRD